MTYPAFASASADVDPHSGQNKAQAKLKRPEYLLLGMGPSGEGSLAGWLRWDGFLISLCGILIGAIVGGVIETLASKLPVLPRMRNLRPDVGEPSSHRREAPRGISFAPRNQLAGL